MTLMESTHERRAPRSNRPSQLALGLAVVLVVMLGWWFVAGRHQAVPSVVEGWATPNISGSAIGLSSEPGGEEEGYIIAGAWWWDGGGWRDGSHLPTCIGDDPTVTTHVRMGVIHVKSDPAVANTVVWIECL